MHFAATSSIAFAVRRSPAKLVSPESAFASGFLARPACMSGGVIGIYLGPIPRECLNRECRITYAGIGWEASLASDVSVFGFPENKEMCRR